MEINDIVIGLAVSALCFMNCCFCHAYGMNMHNKLLNLNLRRMLTQILSALLAITVHLQRNRAFQSLSATQYAQGDVQPLSSSTHDESAGKDEPSHSHLKLGEMLACKSMEKIQAITRCQPEQKARPESAISNKGFSRLLLKYMTFPHETAATEDQPQTLTASK